MKHQTKDPRDFRDYSDNPTNTGFQTKDYDEVRPRWGDDEEENEPDDEGKEWDDQDNERWD